MVLFVNMKAEFDSVNKEILVGAMKAREVREGLMRQCEEILRKTVNTVRIAKKEGGRGIFDGKGCKTGLLSSCVFTLLHTGRYK